MPKRTRAEDVIDPENPPLTEKDFAQARIGIGHLPAPLQETLRNMRRTRGPQRAPTKTLVSIRLSGDVLAAYRSTGRGWQARIDEDLQKTARALPKRLARRQLKKVASR